MSEKIIILTHDIEQALKEKIGQLFRGEIHFIQVDNLCPYQAIEYIESFGVEVTTDEMDTNGWQYDYWIPFYHAGIKYLISGSGYYGHLKISKYKE